MKKIGILGGTFDPIHSGHLILAEEAKELCNLDEVWFMPAKTPPHKLGKKISEFSRRKSMIELAIQGHSGLCCSDFENTLEGNSYTFNTLEKLQGKYIDDEFYFIMGADSFYEIETWKNPDIILKIVKLIVASRDYSNENLTLKKHFEYLKSKYEIKGIYFLDTMDIDISSTRIRELAGGGESISKYVPESVCRYIEENKLYV
ncbi:nicotinate (nicotinamide) nucleotide adenylyltransferase [Lachnoanaerobaculum gingivalis]|uniref:Probable nicotinate-nucleotide adenylyltransferase n=1 Tax=Lachnoanaerobaculum gingivalis TaxID=2490855 RepID=A0A3P3QYD4_9FIRM|nr:nicotinate-nucleotide adenylyltransferase [Lachnoanaerobaculum gingivalis]RRJ26114.1 nicotinate (nicotinamide) nucleotide adenylyltransferase [Lachnoanaerobaculum gingivalis]